MLTDMFWRCKLQTYHDMYIPAAFDASLTINKYIYIIFTEELKGG